MATTLERIQQVEIAKTEQDLIAIFNNTSSARVKGRILDRVRELNMPYKSKIVDLINSNRLQPLEIW
jgi:hypothetical protein